MKTQEIRKMIGRELKREKRTNALAEALTLRFGEMGRTLTSGEVGGLVKFTREYVRDVPDLLDEVELVAKKEGWFEFVSPVFDVAESWFLESLDKVPDEEGLKGLVGDAYVAYTLVQRLSDALKAKRGKVLLVRDTVQANQLVRRILGEEAVSNLNRSVRENLRISISRTSKGRSALWIDPADFIPLGTEAGDGFSFENDKAKNQFDLTTDDLFSSEAAGQSSERPAASSAASAPPSEPPAIVQGTTSSVLLGVSAPSAIKPGGEFTARFVAYVKELEEDVRVLLEKLSPRSEPRLGVQACRWKIGTKVEVRLSSKRLKISPEVQQFDWSGTRDMLDFDVEVPSDAGECTEVLKFDVAIDKFVVARIRLDMQISQRDSSQERRSLHTGAARTAFASYSVDDRLRVLDRISSVSISAGLDVFLDCLSLHANEKWKPRLASEIKNRDLFLLFWSRNANKSEWVTWEWKTALQGKGKESMQIHPLEPDVNPPTELEELHASDPYMWVRKGIGNP